MKNITIYISYFNCQIFLSIYIKFKMNGNNNNHYHEERREDRLMIWLDIDEEDIEQFRQEELYGRVFRRSQSDILIDVYRRVYQSYPAAVRHGLQRPTQNHNSWVWLHEVWNAEDELDRIRNQQRNVNNNQPIYQT